MAANAMAVAQLLDDHHAVSNVRYPGLAGHAGYDVACRQMHDGFGGMLAFDVGDTQEDAKRFISALNVVYHAVSLGATESLVCIPYLTTMLYMPAERRTTFGVRPNTVRFSAGVEDRESLLKDMALALGSV